jgi:hypothetical protein
MRGHNTHASVISTFNTTVLERISDNTREHINGFSMDSIRQSLMFAVISSAGKHWQD